MIPDRKFRTIAQDLLAKTKAGLVNWARADDPDRSYEVVLPHSRIVLSYRRPRIEPDAITLELQDADGETVGSWAADEPDEQDQDPNPDWPVLHALFAEVHRRVTGWDKVISDIERALAGQGPIGAPAGRK